MMPTKGLVDFHCHLDLYPDHAAMIQEVEAAEVFTLAVTTTPKAWTRNHELTKDTRYVRAALGLHPQLVAERADEIVLWEKYLSETRYIGEVGLDAGPKFYKSFDLQKKIFQRVLQCCDTAGGKIITVHSVRSTKAVLDYIEEYLPSNRCKVVMHWFTGTKSEAKRALEMGCYFSLNAAMFDNPRHVSMISSISVDRILTETDGPFTKTLDRPSKPVDVALVVNAIARLHNISDAEVVVKIQKNIRNLLV